MFISVSGQSQRPFFYGRSNKTVNVRVIVSVSNCVSLMILHNYYRPVGRQFRLFCICDTDTVNITFRRVFFCGLQSHCPWCLSYVVLMHQIKVLKSSHDSVPVHDKLGVHRSPWLRLTRSSRLLYVNEHTT